MSTCVHLFASHLSDRVPRASDAGLGTIGISAYSMPDLEEGDGEGDVGFGRGRVVEFISPSCVRLAVYGGLFMLVTATSCSTVLARLSIF